MMRVRHVITAEELRVLLRYDQTDGSFVWLVSPSPNTPMGATAGYVSKSGYRYIHVNGKKRLCHRLAFLWMTGSFPKAQVDHINGVRNDNRWDNLREATRSFNIQNQRRAHSRNRLGVLGVEQVGKRFVSRIWVDNKAEYLGTFDTAEAAHGAYLSAKRKLHPGCTI